MSEVLLIEDSPLVNEHFKDALPTAHVMTNTIDVRKAARKGQRWTTAFVDMDLPGSDVSALRIIEELRALDPGLRVICYTNLSERGRLLLTMAAYHWLGVKEVMNKQTVSASTLRRVAAGDDPTTPQWRKKLERHAERIDSLFQDYYWATCWREWPRINGSTRVAEKAIPQLRRYQADKFQKDASEAVLDLLGVAGLFSTVDTDTAFTARGADGNQRRATVLVAFAETHSNFFQLPDLSAIAERHAPWNRR